MERNVLGVSECDVSTVNILFKKSSYKTTLLVVYILLTLTLLDSPLTNTRKVSVSLVGIKNT